MALTKVSFRTNIPQALHFPFGNAKESPSTRFPDKVDYYYSVEVDGERQALYATANLHQKLQAAEGFGKGATVEVAKVEVEGGNHKDWEIKVIKAGTPVPQAAAQAPQAGQQGAPTSNGSPQAPQAAQWAPAAPTTAFGEMLDRRAEMYEACMVRARASLNRVFEDFDLEVGDVQRSAATLFIELMRDGYRSVDESPGVEALRALVKRIDSEKAFADIRHRFDVLIHPLPFDRDAQRQLYSALRAELAATENGTAAPQPAPKPAPKAVETKTEGLQDAEPIAADDEFPPDLPEGFFGDPDEPEPKQATQAEPAEGEDGKDPKDPIADGMLTRIEILAREAFGDDRDARLAFFSDVVGRKLTSGKQIPHFSGLDVVRRLKQHLDQKAAA